MVWYEIFESFVLSFVLFFYHFLLQGKMFAPSNGLLPIIRIFNWNISIYYLLFFICAVLPIQTTHTDYPYRTFIRTTHPDYPYRLPIQTTHTDYPYRQPIQITQWNYPIRLPTGTTQLDYPIRLSKETTKLEYPMRLPNQIPMRYF